MRVNDRTLDAAVPIGLLTADGVRISAALDPFVGDSSGESFVVLHGFSGSWRWDSVRRAALALAEFGDVLSIDMRGHGESGGLCTMGNREVLDLDAAVAWLRGRGAARVVPVGFSMGASVVLRHAALVGAIDRSDLSPTDVELAQQLSAAPDAIVSISGPAFWFYRGTAPMRLLHRIVMSRSGRSAARVVRGLRISDIPWDPDALPLAPRDCVAALDIPLLIVHGTADPYFPLEHAKAIYNAASAEQSVELWQIPGMGHAEQACDVEVIRRIGRWAEPR